MQPLFPQKLPTRYLIVDFANLVWRTATVKTTTPFMRKDGYSTKHIFLFLRSISAALKQYPDCVPLFVMEGTSQSRRDVFPEYKAQRHHEEFLVFDPFPDLLRVLPLMACGIARNGLYEADDVIASLVYNLPGQNVVLTTDKDLWQLLDKAIIVNGSKGEVKPEDLEKEFDCPPLSIALYKAIYGDTSDNIPGMKGLRWAQVRPYLQRCTTPGDLERALTERISRQLPFPGEDLKEASASEHNLLINIEHIRKMFELTSLKIVDYQLSVFPGKPESLHDYLEEFECMSLLSEVSRLTRDK